MNEEEISITITAEDEYYTGNPYSSAELEDKLTNITGDEVPEIYYEGILEDGTVYEKTTVPPTEVGTYKATVTVGGVTAEDEFSIVELKITTEDEYYTGNPYSSDVIEAPLATEEEPVVYYEGIGETVYEKTTVPPTEVGTYKATVVLGEATAEDEFAILPLEEVEVPDNDPSDDGVQEDEAVEEDEVVEEEEEDVDFYVPEGSGLDVDANTGDKINVKIIFAVMVISALGVFLASKRRKNA